VNWVRYGLFDTTNCDPPFRNRRNVSTKMAKVRESRLPPSPLLGRDGRRMKAASRTIANGGALTSAA
jgi:hypothetical protein